MEQNKKLFLIEKGSRTGSVWISHRSKTMKGIDNAIKDRETWLKPRIFYIVESDTGIHAKYAIKFEDLNIYSYCTKILKKIEMV